MKSTTPPLRGMVLDHRLPGGPERGVQIAPSAVVFAAPVLAVSMRKTKYS